ncbi:hypothetical protein C0431_09415 [bacterium]|nr:hypothetical protein [bacterium]
MKRLVTLGCCALIASASLASDHNNLDKERPLRFEDAYSIAYRSFEFQNGFRLDTFRRGKPVYNFRSELQYGFAKNKDISIGFEPSYLSESRKAVGNAVEFSYFEGVAREIGDRPAFGYRVDVGVPVSGGKGVDLRARGILTKTVGQFDKIHLNVDVLHSTEAEPKKRQTSLGAVIGYSKPLGYPRRFDQTLLAEFGVEQSRQRGGNLNGWVGLGMRKQLSSTGVLDFGIQTDLFRDKREKASPVRLTVGYSVNF